MKELIRATAAFQTLARDRQKGKLSHAYMLHFADAKNLRAALQLFALEFFNLGGEERDGKRLLAGSLTDCIFYPAEGKKWTVDIASEIVEDSALRPLERDAKLYVLCGFEQASPIVQNKLLKVLEEPPSGVHFLLGATALAPVLDTVKSRVKTLTIPPFTSDEIFAALEREKSRETNAEAAENCGGILGVAQEMAEGARLRELEAAADEICLCPKERMAEVAIRYGDAPLKNELLSCVQRRFHTALKQKSCGLPQGKIAQKYTIHALIYAVELINKAFADVKFNAFFQGLLYDLMLRVGEENDKWLKLQE